jgi:hypothetical protein
MRAADPTALDVFVIVALLRSQLWRGVQHDTLWVGPAQCPAFRRVSGSVEGHPLHAPSIDLDAASVQQQLFLHIISDSYI